MNRVSAIFLLVCCFYIGYSQDQSNEAKLLKRLASAKHDTMRVIYMINFVTNNSTLNNAKSLEYALKAIELSKKINYSSGLISAYEAAGDAYWYAYNYNKSIDNYLLELKLADSLNIPYRVAKANYNIGWIKCVQQEIFSERGKLINSLHVFERLHDTTSVMQVCNALASVYMNYYKTHHRLLDSANYYFRGMIFMGEHSSVKNNLVNIYGNYSIFLTEHKKFSEAKLYALKALKVVINNKDTFGYVNTQNIMALLYYHTDSCAKAKKIINEILPVIKKKDYKTNLLDAYKTLFMIYKKEKDFKSALEYHLLYKEVNDTLNAVVFRSNPQEKETSFEIEKREANIHRLENINEVSELKNKQNSYIIWGMAFVAILIIGFAFNLYKGNKNKQRANLKLSEQNRIIADKKQEIEQSIQYAKGIQNAVLPSIAEFKQALPNSFLIYLPKDVVSGDFYWMHVSSELWDRGSETNSSELGDRSSEKYVNHELQTTNSKLLIAAADCTGHGVPGSLMSIVSVDKLNQAVFGKKLFNPGQILGSINNDIKNALKQDTSANIQKDGLDIALIQFNTLSNILTYAGANRPLWIIRGGSLLEYKATKTSIAGHTPFNYHFEEQTIPLYKNDLVMIFSDGYADQFGGTNGKKMMTRNFKDYVLSVAALPVNEIEKGILNHFNAWKGQYEQVDDVLVIGFKI